MKNTMKLSELLNEPKEKEKELVPIKLLACLQAYERSIDVKFDISPYSTILERTYTLITEGEIYGGMDVISQTDKSSGYTIVYLGHWNDGVV